MKPTPDSPAEPEPVHPHIAGPPHAPGQIIGPTASASAPPTDSDLPMPADTGERPTAVVMPGQTDNSVINGQIIGQKDTKHSPLKRFSKRSVLILLLVPLLLLGGSAAAYFGYVVPNKPENVLAKAIANSLSQHQITTKGTLDATSSGFSTKIEYTAATNEDSHATDLNLNTTISGVNIPMEIISAKGNVYFKVGNLSSLEGIANQFIGDSTPSIKTLEDQINKSITNQWISVDSTLIKEAKLDCLASFPASFSQTDIKSLKAAYANAQFAAISSHSADTVNGAKATKYEVKIDDNVLSKFNLNGTSYFKNINDCLKKADPTSTLDLSSSKDGDTTPITIWVDSAKRIVKYSSQSTAKDKAKGIEGDITGTITYGNVNISAPTSSKPVLNLLNDLNLNSLFNGSSNSPNTTGSGLPTILN